jgi:hypothetical protein
MADRVLIIADTEGLQAPYEGSSALYRFGSGTDLQLLRDDDPRYFKVAFDGRPVFVAKSSARQIDGAGHETIFVAPSPPASAAIAHRPRRLRIATDTTAFEHPSAGSAVLTRFGAGSVVPLIGDGDALFFQVAYQGRTMYVPRTSGVDIAAQDVVFVPPAAERPRHRESGMAAFWRIALLVAGVALAATGVGLVIAAAPVASQIENSGREGVAFGVGGAIALLAGLSLIRLTYRPALQFALVVTGFVLAFAGGQLLLLAIPMSKMDPFDIDPERAKVAMTWAGALLAIIGTALAAFVVVGWVRSAEARSKWPQAVRWIAIIVGGVLLFGGTGGAGGALAAQGEELSIEVAAASGALLPLTVIPGGILLFFGVTMTGQAGARPFRSPAAFWAMGLFVIAVGIGGLVTMFEGDWSWLMSPAHACAALLPAIAVMAVASRGGIGWTAPIAGLSQRRAWMALALGIVIVTSVAGTIDGLIAETLGVALLAGSGAFDGLRTMDGVGEVASNADIYLSRGEQAFLAVMIVVILAPIMEEGFKGLFTALAMPARASAAVGFTTGVAVGAGFGVLEASLYGLGGLAEDSTIDWWSLMLLRAGATSMHALNTGLLGLALYAGMQGRGVSLALVFYAIAVGFHAIWNGLSVLAGSRFIFEFNDLTDEQLSWIAFGIMAPLGIAVVIALWAVARATYRDSPKVGQGAQT